MIIIIIIIIRRRRRRRKSLSVLTRLEAGFGGPWGGRGGGVGGGVAGGWGSEVWGWWLKFWDSALFIG